MVAYCTDAEKLQIAYVRQTKEICCWKERGGSRETSNLRTVLKSLMSQPSRLIDYNFLGTRVKIEKLLWSSQNQFCFIFIQLQFIVCHPSFHMRHTRLSWVNNFRKFRNVATLKQLVVIWEAVMWERTIRYNFRNMMGLKDTENQTQHWPMGDTKVHSRKSRGHTIDKKDLCVIREVRLKTKQCQKCQKYDEVWKVE